MARRPGARRWLAGLLLPPVLLAATGTARFEHGGAEAWCVDWRAVSGAGCRAYAVAHEDEGRLWLDLHPGAFLRAVGRAAVGTRIHTAQLGTLRVTVTIEEHRVATGSAAADRAYRLVLSPTAAPGTFEPWTSCFGESTVTTTEAVTTLSAVSETPCPPGSYEVHIELTGEVVRGAHASEASLRVDSAVRSLQVEVDPSPAR